MKHTMLLQLQDTIATEIIKKKKYKHKFSKIPYPALIILFNGIIINITDYHLMLSKPTLFPCHYSIIRLLFVGLS